MVGRERGVGRGREGEREGGVREGGWGKRGRGQARVRGREREYKSTFFKNR